jgi:TorA maturation chaperone TorD
MLAGLIRGRFGAPATLAAQREFFARHIAPWAPHFYSDLAAIGDAPFHAAVGEVGRAFLAIEKEAFRLAGDSPR